MKELGDKEKQARITDTVDGLAIFSVYAFLYLKKDK